MCKMVNNLDVEVFITKTNEHLIDKSESEKD
jgi:hypothetical protein